MLQWIRVRNVAVIDELEVDFEPGLNLLTGETGAGKSILIDALGLVLGARATSDLVRTGAESAVVEAGFLVRPLPESLARRLEEAGIEPDEELVIRREVTRAGRGKVAVNASAGARGLLRDLAPFLADIHGQGETSSLLRAEAGLDLLDRFGGAYPLREEVRQAYGELRACEESLRRCKREMAQRAELIDRVGREVRELDEAGLRPGEDTELLEERKILAHAERLKSLADDAYDSLYEADGSVLSRLVPLWKKVEELATIDARWAPYLDERENISSQLEDLALFARDYAETIDVAPGKLEALEARLSLLERVKKKYGGTLEHVIERHEAARQKLDELRDSESRVAELERELASARAAYEKKATSLSKRRKKLAKELERRVAGELPSLALEKARLVIAVHTLGADAETEEWREHGLDSVELLFSANAGEDPRPLSKAASGGELSRFMLALKAVSAKGERPKTLVFDEVDAGIGGRVADAVGDKLAELAALHQVICVTHLPQIASFAPAHFRIDKIERKGRTETRVRRLDPKERVDEIARMLAGAVVTESARKHAKQLVSAKSPK